MTKYLLYIYPLARFKKQKHIYNYRLVFGRLWTLTGKYIRWFKTLIDSLCPRSDSFNAVSLLSCLRSLSGRVLQVHCIPSRSQPPFSGPTPRVSPTSRQPPLPSPRTPPPLHSKIKENSWTVCCKDYSHTKHLQLNRDYLDSSSRQHEWKRSPFALQESFETHSSEQWSPWSVVRFKPRGPRLLREKSVLSSPLGSRPLGVNPLRSQRNHIGGFLYEIIVLNEDNPQCFGPRMDSVPSGWTTFSGLCV